MDMWISVRSGQDSHQASNSHLGFLFGCTCGCTDVFVEGGEGRGDELLGGRDSGCVFGDGIQTSLSGHLPPGEASVWVDLSQDLNQGNGRPGKQTPQQS